MEPREYSTNFPIQPSTNSGRERFGGFSILGISFQSGHTLAYRRFPQSSVGPAFSSVWMREPGGDWRIFSTAPADVSCAKYMLPALADQVEIHDEWLDAHTLRVTIPAIRMEWTTRFTSNRMSNFMSAVISRTPSWIVRSRPGSTIIARTASRLLRARRLRLRGFVPNGQRFTARPKAIWLVANSEAAAGEFDFGDAITPASQHRLADFWIPVRPLAMAGHVEIVNARGATADRVPFATRVPQ